MWNAVALCPRRFTLQVITCQYKITLILFLEVELFLYLLCQHILKQNKNNYPKTAGCGQRITKNATKMNKGNVLTKNRYIKMIYRQSIFFILIHPNVLSNICRGFRSCYSLRNQFIVVKKLSQTSDSAVVICLASLL